MTPLELKVLRKSLGVSAREAADIVGCSLKTWQRMENGKVKINRLRVEELKRQTGVVFHAFQDT